MTAVCGVVVIARGSALFGVLLLGAVVAELLVLKVYKGGTERGDDRDRG